MHKSEFLEFLLAGNVAGSGKASSYVKALDHLGSMLQIRSFGFEDCIDIFNVRSVERLGELFELVQQEKRKDKGSIWLSQDVPTSYLLNGFCAAAIRSYQGFLKNLDQEDRLLNEFQGHVGSVEELVQKLDV